MVKNFGGKKLWRMLTCIANQRLTVNQSQMKQFQTIVSLAWPDHFLAHAGHYRL